MLKSWLKRWPFARPNAIDASAQHSIASYRLDAGHRIYAIGDIHGQFDLLMRLQEKIAADLRSRPVEHALLVYLGDYIDRGGRSREVVDCLLNPSDTLPQAILLRGNHEQTLLDCLENPARFSDWREFGGVETLLSYGVDANLLRSRADNAAIMAAFAQACASHLAFYTSLSHSFAAGGYFFCHAGVRPGIALARQIPEDLMWIREAFLQSATDFGAIVVHGHTPVDEPEIRPNRINIDTGAYVSRRLTAAVIEADDVAFLTG